MEDVGRMKTRPTKAVHSRAMSSRKSVVAVIVGRQPSPPNTKLDMSYGSGFVIKEGPHGSLILTCQHVVEGAVSLCIRRVVVGGGVEEFEATVIGEDSFTDLAVLRVRQGLSNQCSLALNLTRPGQVNEPVVTIGYCNPEELLDKISLARLPAMLPGCIQEDDTLLEAYREEAGKRVIGREAGITHELILLNCSSIMGVSGGPVVDRHGVIGMSSKMGTDDVPIMLAVSSNTIFGVLKDFAGLMGLATMEEAVSRLVVM